MILFRWHQSATLPSGSKKEKIVEKKEAIDKNKKSSLTDILINYSSSPEFGKPFTFTHESYDQFLLTTIKNVYNKGQNIGYLTISENANDIRAASQGRAIWNSENSGFEELPQHLYEEIIGDIRTRKGLKADVPTESNYSD